MSIFSHICRTAARLDSRKGCRALPFVAAFLLLTMVSGCQKENLAPQTLVVVQTAIVRLMPITEHITADAVLTPIAQAAISPKISAPVKTFYVQRGSKVKKGQLLAMLDNRDLEAAVEDSQGNYDAAQAGYQTATEALVPQESQRAKLDLAQAKANLALNQQIVRSRKQLFAEGAIPGRDLDTAQAALVQAQTAYQMARQRFNAMEQVGRAAALKSARGQLESAKGKYLGAEAQLQYSEIRSPITGVVTDRPLFAGEASVAGAPLLTVMDVSSLLAKVHLSQAETQALKIGDSASVTIPGVDAPVAGKVTLISPALDPGSTTVEVWVLVPNPEGRFKPGTSVGVSIIAKTIPNALVVPESAILTGSNGEKRVMVVRADDHAYSQTVTTGVQQGNLIQIVSGLQPGAQVIVGGAYGLPDASRVKPIPADEDSNPQA